MRRLPRSFPSDVDATQTRRDLPTSFNAWYIITNGTSNTY
jgi:hypothetical protein